jgi:hypothetical protein
MMKMMKMMALAFGAAAALDDTTSGTRCAHTNCLEWDCAEWCECYDETKNSVYADAGCADSGEDTCNCAKTVAPKTVAPKPKTVAPKTVAQSEKADALGYTHLECTNGPGTNCNLDGALSWTGEPCQDSQAPLQAHGRCWQSTLQKAEEICNRHTECGGITRDNGGYEPRKGEHAANHHVAAHEVWIKNYQASSKGAVNQLKKSN